MIASTGVSSVAAALGAVIGLGLALIAVGLRGSDLESLPVGRRWQARVETVRSLLGQRARERLARRLGIAALAGVAVGFATGWPVGALLAGAAAWALPTLWRPDAGARERTDRIEAVAVWTEMLRDTLSAAAGLEQSILATAQTAPAPIAAEVSALAERIRDGDRLTDALHAFADDLDDATGDLVVAALVMAATRQARQLTDLLSSLARAAREQSTMRLRVEAGRARIRSSVRVVVGVTLAMAGALVVLNRGYLRPYDAATGQLVLLAAGLLFAAAFTWLDRIAAIPSGERIMRPTPGEATR